MKDYIIKLLLSFVIIYQSLVIYKANQDLKNTLNVVYYLSDKLDIAYEMINSLNSEIDKNYQEIDSYKHLERIKKELDRSKQ